MNTDLDRTHKRAPVWRDVVDHVCNVGEELRGWPENAGRR